MSDPNLSDFYGRVSRIQLARAKGQGFEAPGTLGRSFYSHPKVRRRSIIGPVLFLLVCAVLLKGTIHHNVGAASYDERVAGLMAGEGVDWIGGWLMQPDAATLFVSDRITAALATMM